MKSLSEKEFVSLLLKKCSNYTEDEGIFLFQELKLKLEDTRKLIFDWLQTGEEKDVKEGEWSIKKIQEKYSLNYIAATLTIDWLKREPNLAQRALQMGFK